MPVQTIDKNIFEILIGVFESCITILNVSPSGDVFFSSPTSKHGNKLREWYTYWSIHSDE